MRKESSDLPKILRSLLKLLSEVVKKAMAHQCGNHGDAKIRAGKNVVQGEGQGLSLSVSKREFAHQQIGIKQENNKADFDNCPEEGSEAPRPPRIRAPLRVIFAR